MSTLEGRRIGIEVEAETEHCHLGLVQGMLGSILSTNSWVAERDHSLRGGPNAWEVKTAGEYGMKYEDVRKGMFELMPILCHNTGTWRAAVHTHVDVRDFTMREKAALLAFLYTLDDSIFGKFAPARRESNFCVPLGNEVLRTLDTIHDIDCDMLDREQLCKYTSINVMPLVGGAHSGGGTFEFRHMGTPNGSDTPRGAYEQVLHIWRFAHTCASLVDLARQYMTTYRREKFEYYDVRHVASMITDPYIVDEVDRLDLEFNQEAVLNVINRFCSTTQKIPINIDLLSMYKAAGNRSRTRPQVEASVAEQIQAHTTDYIWMGEQ